MKIWVRTILLSLLLLSICQAEGRVSQIAVFQDGWGNIGSLWDVEYQDTRYVILKVKESNKEGEAADIVLDREKLGEFEEHLLKLKRSHNPLKNDGFEIRNSIASGDAIVKFLYARMNGQRFKAIQVTQTKSGEKREHNLSVNSTSYTGLKLGIKKARRVLGWQ